MGSETGDKVFLTWGPLEAAGAASLGAAPPSLPPPPPPRPGAVTPRERAPYAMLAGVVALAGDRYAYELPLLNPYLPTDQGVDQTLLRKWRAGVLHDIILRRRADRLTVRTALYWADLSWPKILQVLYGLPPTDNPAPGSQQCSALALAYLVLAGDGKPPAAFAGGRTKERVHRYGKKFAYKRMPADGVYDAVTKKPVWSPPKLSVRAYQDAFAGWPLPEKVNRRSGYDGYGAHPHYEGLWLNKRHRRAPRRGRFASTEPRKKIVYRRRPVDATTFASCKTKKEKALERALAAATRDGDAAAE